MDAGKQVRVAPVTVAGDLDIGDLRAALAAGWADYRAQPGFGLFLSAIFVAAGILLSVTAIAGGAAIWLVPVAAGFPLLAPFAAVGLYEVSRRRGSGLPMTWAAILRALGGRGDEQILSMGVIVFVAFGFWIIVVHGIFAIFLDRPGIDPLAQLLSGPGVLMLLVGSAVGGVMAFAFYAITVISLPMLVDRDVDFVTAIIVSLGTVRSNTAVMLAWAAIIATALFIAMLPLFLGLLVVLPVLGHATWHLYRRVVGEPE